MLHFVQHDRRALSRTFFLVILSGAKNLGVPITRDASLALSMTTMEGCFADAQHDNDGGMLR
jgi:hypothetical protein